MAPRSAYAHVPFCAHRCGYCDFTVVADRLDLADRYLAAVECETQSQLPPREVDTLYVGGGTPTQLPIEKLDRLFDALLAWRPLAAGGEWTVEANPLDVTEPLVQRLAQRGVTRVSLGGQSFDDAKLRTLERDHSADDLRRAVTLVKEGGIDACLDLIFASPDESLDAWRRDLDEAIALTPQHVSTYGLTFEKGTTFWGRRERSELAEVDDSRQRAMYVGAIDALTGAGYEHYEVSNFARPGHRSRHNLAYWSGDGCWAVGPGAARLVGPVRETNHRSTFTYLRRVETGDSPVAEREQLTTEQLAREALVFGLRRIDGVDTAAFAERYGVAVDELAGEAVARFVRQGAMTRQGTRLKLTRDGLLVSDAMWPDLL
ncbi:MAG: radical SAM family heme chaperone HemW [Planctomycetota bacterium]